MPYRFFFTFKEKNQIFKETYTVIEVKNQRSLKNIELLRKKYCEQLQ